MIVYKVHIYNKFTEKLCSELKAILIVYITSYISVNRHFVIGEKCLVWVFTQAVKFCRKLFVTRCIVYEFRIRLN